MTETTSRQQEELGPKKMLLSGRGEKGSDPPDDSVTYHPTSVMPVAGDQLQAWRGLKAALIFYFTLGCGLLITKWEAYIRKLQPLLHHGHSVLPPKA